MRQPTKSYLLVNSALKLILQARVDFKSNLFTNSSKPYHEVFRYLHSISKSSSLPPNVHLNGSALTITPLQRVELFSSYFHSIYQPCNMEILENLNFSSEIPTSFQLCEFDCSEEIVYDILASLDPSKATGIDSIGPKLLRRGAFSLCKPIYKLLQHCITHKCIPNEWKIHLVTPILKSGNSSNVANY